MQACIAAENYVAVTPHRQNLSQEFVCSRQPVKSQIGCIDNIYSQTHACGSIVTGGSFYELSKLVKVLFSLPYSNADLEWGFRESKHFLGGQSSLSIASNNGMHHVKFPSVL